MVGSLYQKQSCTLRCDFLERLGFLVDYQWTWRENQALARRLHVAKLKGGACVEEIDYSAARGVDKSVMRALAQKSAWVANHDIGS